MSKQQITQEEFDKKVEELLIKRISYLNPFDKQTKKEAKQFLKERYEIK